MTNEVIGDIEADRPLILIDAPDLKGRRFGALPGQLDVSYRPRLRYNFGALPISGQLIEQGEIAYPGRRRPEPGEGAAGFLMVAETHRGLRAVVDYFAHNAFGPTLIVVFEHEPDLVAKAIDEAPVQGVPIGLHVPPEVLGLAFAQQMIDSELARGNEDPRVDGVGYDPRSSLIFRYPMDAEALEAEFEFDDGIEFLHRGRVPFLAFTTPDGSLDGWSGWGIGGAREFAPASVRAARDRWWAEWRSNPRPRIRLTNPFRPELPPKTPEQLAVDARHAARRAARAARSAERGRG